MNNLHILDQLNDPEIAERMVSRREALRGGGKAGAALAIASVPIALAAMAKNAFAQGSLPQQVIDVLNFALTLEYLEDEFYRAGMQTSGLIPGGDRDIFGQIALHERDHVKLLKGALGSAAVPKPNFDFTAGGMFDPFNDYPTFQALAQGFEDTGVRAYKGQAGNLQVAPGILTVALRIHSVEARHASEVRRLRGLKGWITFNNTDVAALAATYAGEENHVHLGIDVGNTAAATEAFDEPLTVAEVLAIAGPFIVP